MTRSLVIKTHCANIFTRAQLRAFHTDEASLTVATTPRTKSQHSATSNEVSGATELLSTSEDIANNFCFNSPDVDRRDTSVSISTHPSHRPLTSIDVIKINGSVIENGDLHCCEGPRWSVTRLFNRAPHSLQVGAETCCVADGVHALVNPHDWAKTRAEHHVSQVPIVGHGQRQSVKVVDDQSVLSLTALMCWRAGMPIIGTPSTYSITARESQEAIRLSIENVSGSTRLPGTLISRNRVCWRCNSASPLGHRDRRTAFQASSA